MVRDQGIAFADEPGLVCQKYHIRMDLFQIGNTIGSGSRVSGAKSVGCPC
jgi:hypothetical protein